MRIGEILILRESIDPWILSHTLKEQAVAAQRLVSLLIHRALLDPDDGALALSEHVGFPAAMQRHLERRDPEVTGAIPAELGRRWAVLPIGRARNGSLVVVARDPTPILAASLEHATSTPIVLAVTPTLQIERLIRNVYGPPERTAPVAVAMLSHPDISEIPPQYISRRARTISDASLGGDKLDLPVRRARLTELLDSTLDEIDRSITVFAAERRVMDYCARRWQGALLLKIVEGTALGHRANGTQLGSVDGIAISVTAPTLIQRAHDLQKVTSDAPVSGIQDRLSVMLGNATTPTAAPIMLANRVDAILAVGDPVEHNKRDTISDLARLADALGAVYTRFARAAS